jgi:hypothetical protein
MSLLILLKENESIQDVLSRIEGLENAFGFKLASTMKSFYLAYDISKFSEYSPYLYYNAEYNTLLPFYSLIYDSNTDYQVEKLFTVDEIYANAKNVYENEHEFWDKKMIPIAECFDQGYLLVDCSEKGMGELYMEYGHKDDLEFVSNNIFEYCSPTGLSLLTGASLKRSETCS